MAPWFCDRNVNRAKAIPHSGKAGRQIGDSRGNGLADIQAREKLRSVYAVWPSHIISVYVE